MDEEVPGPAGPLQAISLPSTDDDDVSFDPEMTKADKMHAWDDYDVNSSENISVEEQEALNAEADQPVPDALLAGGHKKPTPSPASSSPLPASEPRPRRKGLTGMPRIRTLTPPSPYDSDSPSDDHVDPEFDPESIHPVDMENPEVRQS